MGIIDNDCMVCRGHELACERADVEICKLTDEIKRLQSWVNDLQSGMYINYVYCGHRYGPRKDTPAIMADILKEHIEQCPQHPLSHAKAEARQFQNERNILADWVARYTGRTVPQELANATAEVARGEL